MQNVMRSEKKYLITLEQYYRLSGRLERIMKQDAHNGALGYKVRSLYFDTHGDQDFWDKQGGLELRKKLRLRTYSPDSGFAMLEMKKKQGDNQQKRSLKVSREDARALCRRDYTPLLSYDAPFAAECFGVLHMQGYRPRAVVEYRRRAYTAKEFSTRITFDQEVVATESCADIFSKQLCMYPVFDPYYVIMEVKYNGCLLSYIKDLLNGCDKNELSVSKYCLGRTVSMHYDY